MNLMKVALGKGDIRKTKCDALGLMFVEGELRLSAAARAADQATHGAVSRVIGQGFKGKKDEVEKIAAGKSSSFGLIVLIGLGARDKLDLEDYRRAGGLFIGALNKGKGMKCHAEMCEHGKAGITVDDVTRSFVEGAMARNYRYTDYKTRDPKPGPAALLALYGEPRMLARGIERGVVSGEAQCFARDLVNRPGGDLTPEDFAREAKAVARKHKLAIKVWDERALKRAGMNAILAVGQGSHHPPRLVAVRYRGTRRDKPDLVLVGKGITFDSGGISLKPGPKMDEMKDDMSGAADVLAATAAAARLRLKVNVTAVMALAENLPGGGAQRPGDIIRTASGLTVEVKNTDAEGRLVLADALHYATTLKSRFGIVDLATLTGACTIALGSQAIGLMGNNEELLAKVGAAALASGERTWLLPLWDEYDELIESQIADMINTSTRREAGTIVGGVFLKQFVGKTAWAHLDIASVAWTVKNGAYLAPGPSGKGTRLLIRLLEGMR
ncbi:MAG TPA: leucyl aminopeptidase [bacterium]|nr:leucyl aminopeptidase [bacterium]